MELVAFLGEDEENWGQVTGLLNHGEWEKAIIIKTKSALKYSHPKITETVIVDSTKPLTELKEIITKEMKNKLSGFDANVSIASGNGKEHMALISALLSVPVGIRLVVFTKKGIEWVN